jgi:hypothetical protein
VSPLVADGEGKRRGDGAAGTIWLGDRKRHAGGRSTWRCRRCRAATSIKGNSQSHDLPIRPRAALHHERTQLAIPFAYSGRSPAGATDHTPQLARSGVVVAQRHHARPTECWNRVVDRHGARASPAGCCPLAARGLSRPRPGGVAGCPPRPESFPNVIAPAGRPRPVIAPTALGRERT